MKSLTNECDTEISVEDGQEIVTMMDSCDVNCPHGEVHHIEGFSEVFAFVCGYCAESVAL